MKKVVFLIFLFIGLMPNVLAKTSSETAEFVRCVDGDTAVLKVDGEEQKFRFLAIDTPETVHPTVDVEAYGKDASEFTCNRLTNAMEIMVEYEDSNKIDKYGRHLAWIWVDGTLLQEELIKIGYGEVAYIYGTYRYTQSLCLVQKNAKDNALGLWMDKDEEGYCATVDLNGVENVIDYNKIDVLEAEDEVKIPEELEKIDEYLDTFSNYMEENDEKIQKIFTYVFLGLAVIVCLYREFKKD